MGSNSGAVNDGTSGQPGLFGPTGALHRPPPAETLDWARRTVGERSRILATWTLKGGISHANHAIDIVDGGGTVNQLVIRRWARPDWELTDPEYTPAQEVATYRLLASSAVPRPDLVAADVGGQQCDVPAILVTRLAGEPGSSVKKVSSLTSQLAAVLPLVHDVDPEGAESIVPSYRPYYVEDDLRPPDWATLPAIWERAFEISTGPEPDIPWRFIHRDYHPDNTVWRDGRLVGIVDWTSASWGPPPIDIGHMRANLAADIGIEAADAFLTAYRSLDASFDYHPFWDVRAVVDFISDLDAESHLVGPLEALVARAVAELG
jgi:aminoglycoside phosphotransferase (APT) family kinase protein